MTRFLSLRIPRTLWVLVVIMVLAVVPSSPSWSQLRLIPAAEQSVYEALPTFPRETQYVPRDSDDTNEDPSTLVRRLMLYHLQVKGRSLSSRLDWKLTLADYLEANEPMFPQAYPGARTLTENPFNRDRELIKALTRPERNQVLEVILTAFGGDPTPPQLYIPPNLGQGPTPNPELLRQPDSIVLPSPGGADLLR